MNARTVRLLTGLGLIVAAIVVLVVLQSDSGDDGGSSNGGAVTQGNGNEGEKVPTIAIENGKPVGGVRELSYQEGDQIRFKVSSDISEEIHVHGYDLAKEVEAGGAVSFDFPATIEGLFEAELEERGEQIAELRVNP